MSVMNWLPEPAEESQEGASARSPGSTASAGWLFVMLVMSDGWTFITLSFDLAAPSSVGALELLGKDVLLSVLRGTLEKRLETRYSTNVR